MSLVKSLDNVYDTSVTIKRLLKTGTVVNGTTYNFRLYAQINNKYARLKWEISPGESVFIKCEIEANAKGYIYGKTTGANIFVDGSTHKIQWRNGTTVVYEKAVDDKIHTIGWIGYVPDSQSLSGRGWRPFYDTYDDDAPVVTGTGLSSYYARIGGATDTDDCINSTGSWAIRLYEVQANASYQNGDLFFRNFHYYVVDSSGAGFLVNTLYDFGGASFSNGTSVSGVTPSNTAVNFPSGVEGYGVQLHDLRHICKTGYNDLIAILTEDGGLDKAAGWTVQGTGVGQAEAPCTLTKDSDVRSFAFGLSSLSRPAGWTIGNAGTLGELKLGRTPKWSIWNDAIKFGKFATDASPSKLRFNLFCKNDGTYYSKFDLSVFEGYNNADSQNHPPFFSIGDDSGNIVLESHNGVPCTILAGDSILGRYNDEQTAFKYNLASGALGNVCLGNMPPWNYTEAEIAGSSATPGMARLATFGGGLLFKSVGAGSVFLTLIELTKQTYPNSTNLYPLCSGSDQETVNKFKIEGFSGEAFFRESLASYLRYRIHTDAAPFQFDVVLGMVKSATIKPNDSQLIDCTNFAPERRVTATASDNPRVYDAPTTSADIYYGDRLLIGGIGGKEKVADVEYDLNVVWGGSRSTYYRYANQTVGPSLYSVYGKYLYITAALGRQLPDNTFDFVTLYNDSTRLYVGYVEVTVAQAYSSAVYSTIKFKTRGFTPLFKNTDGDSSYYYNPLSQSEFFTRNSYPLNVSNISVVYAGVAAFDWQDLLYPGTARGSSGSITPVDPSGVTGRPANPFTAHFRVFKKSDAPHTWNIYMPNSTYWTWSDAAENPYKTLASKNYQLHIDTDCLIDYNNSDAVDVWMSIYNSSNVRLKNTTSDTTVIKTALVGRTITIYSKPEYEPKEQRVVTTEFTYAITSSTGWDSNISFRHNVNANWTLVIDVDDIPFWSKTLDGQPDGVGASSYVHIRAIYNGTISNMAAKTYFINIS